jgi:hypothetical protein
VYHPLLRLLLLLLWGHLLRRGGTVCAHARHRVLPPAGLPKLLLLLEGRRQHWHRQLLLLLHLWKRGALHGAAADQPHHPCRTLRAEAAAAKPQPSCPST